MKLVFPWLVVFSVMLGLNVRVLATDAVNHAAACSATVETCCQDQHGNTAPLDHGENDEDCPLDHHHHHDCCAHAPLLTVENEVIRRLGVPGSSLPGVRHEGEVPPEGPFLGSEKPPLI